LSSSKNHRARAYRGQKEDGERWQNSLKQNQTNVLGVGKNLLKQEIRAGTCTKSQAKAYIFGFGIFDH